MADQLKAYVATKEYPNPSDTPPSERRGFNPPVIGPDDTPAEIRHKQSVQASLARDAADAQAAEAKRAAAQSRLDGVHLNLLGPDAAKLLEDKIAGACHGSPGALQNVIAVLRELGFQR